MTDEFEMQENIVVSMVEMYVDAVYKEFLADKSAAMDQTRFKRHSLQMIATKLQRRAFELEK